MILFKKMSGSIYLTGLLFISISLLIFALPDFLSVSTGSRAPGMFMINYLITVLYFVILLAGGRLGRGRNGLHPLILFLILFLISAYSLNREMGIFERSANWFCIVLVVVSINCMAFIVFDRLPEWLRYMIGAIAGLSMVVFAYLSAFLTPVYLIGAFTFFVLGISLHTFVPIIFCICIWRLMRRVSIETKKYFRTFVAGMAVTVLSVSAYVVSYNNTLGSINHHFQYSSISENDQLPAWVGVAQQMPKNELAEKILKTDLVYSVPAEWEENFFWRMPNLNFEQKIHDPLVMISSFVCGKVHVPVEERIKILETLYDSRHQAQERLWSGDDIYTEEVSDHVQLWPKFRLSYSELELIITHAPIDRSWSHKQEAIYTFHLPEGGVVTSLSLWIDGKEEKGILTSKAKADSAYKQIVGVENRDPSVVHWQEGNTVTVRVFPVLNGESRKFKLGITAPLRADGNRLCYDNIYFDGPSFSHATERISISAKDPLTELSLPNGFTADANVAARNGIYNPSWSVAFAAPPIAGDAFHFGNYSYQVLPAQKQRVPFNALTVYLDINAAWTPQAFERTYELVKSRKVYAATGGESLSRITESNKNSIFNQLRKNHFSMFPFYKIPANENALVITQGGALSPVISDIRNSAFMQQTQEYFQDGKAAYVFDLGTELSPYLRSLKEFRTLNYDRGDEKKLQSLLSANRFDKIMETDSGIAIQDAGIELRRTYGVFAGNAPDHLMRLFAYNHIFHRYGRSLLSDTAAQDSVVDEAREAYVVSPVSSLVVLETKKDYDRFDIRASKNSLQNASLKSKGAVPEPAQWALIILVAALSIFITFSPQLSAKSIK